MGGPGSGRPKQEASRRSSASKAPKVTLASLAAVVETQRIEIASLRASVELLLARGPLEGERGVPDVGGDGERHRQSELPLLLPPKPSPPHPSGEGTSKRGSASDQAHLLGRYVRQKSATTLAPARCAKLDALPGDALHAIASHLGALDLGRLLLCRKGLMEGLRGASPSEVVMHGSEISRVRWDHPIPSVDEILAAPPTTKLGWMCRNLRESGAARQLRELRVFLWEDFRVEAPEVKALLRECGALQRFELGMPTYQNRSRDFKECAFIWIERILEAAPSSLTTLQVPIIPAILDRSQLSRFPNLENLVVATYGASESRQVVQAKQALASLGVYKTCGSTSAFDYGCPGVIESILLSVPRLRSLVVRRSNLSVLRPDIKLVSESLESLDIQDKCACVDNYRCPKLRTLQLSCYLQEPEASAGWTALKTGIHALDITTVPLNYKAKWSSHGFTDGIFVAEMGP